MVCRGPAVGGSALAYGFTSRGLRRDDRGVLASSLGLFVPVGCCYPVAAAERENVVQG